MFDTVRRLIGASIIPASTLAASLVILIGVTL